MKVYIPYLKECLYFSAILVAILFVFQKILIKGVTYSDNNRTDKVNRIFDHEIRNDIVVFGTSVAEVGMNANVLSEKLNQSVYNAAIDGTSFPQYKCLIEELSDYSTETKYVLLAITYFDFMNMRQLYAPDRFYAHLDNKHVFDDFKSIDSDKIIKMRYVPFYAITQFSNLFYKFSAIGWKNHFTKSRKVDEFNGFVPHYNKYVSTITDSSKDFIKLDSAQKYSFLKLREKLRKSNKEIIVVFMPMYRAGQNHFTNLNEIASSIKEWVGADHFIDYTNSVYCDDKDNFYNNNHLNLTGATLVTEDLANQLLSRGIVKKKN